MPAHDIAEQIRKIADAFEKHGYDDLKHFAELGSTLKRIEEKTDAQTKQLEEQQKTLAPIALTYGTMGTLGRWMMPLTVFVSLIVGIIWGLVQIIFHHN